MTTSEEKADSLYGAAPEGDEDPHASQAVPDPGDSPSYALLVQPFLAGSLTIHHLGRHVKVTDGKTSIQGELCRIQHGASYVDDSALGEGPRVVLGQRWVQVEFLGYGGARVRPDATVELLD